TTRPALHLAIGSLLALMATACGGEAAGGAEAAPAMASPKVIQLIHFTNAEVAAQLDDTWEHPEDGVFVRHGDYGGESRLAVGSAGLAADIARLQAELDTRAGELADRPAS